MTELALGALNRARYAGLDFDTHNDDLLARLQVKYAADFNDFAISSLGIMLLDLTAYGLDTLSFYLDRRATDVYLATARTRKSVARASRQLGYKMGGAVASSVDLRVTVNEVYPFNVTIPARFRFKGPDGLLFETAEAVTFTPAEQGHGTSKFIPCYEGETIAESFVSDGTPAQVFELRRVPEGKFVVQDAVECRVDGAPWEAVDLIQYGATDQFETGFNDEPATIRFGDGLAGNIPGAGASVDVTYVASRGKAGQVVAGSIASVETPLVVAFTTIPLTVTNPRGSVGGDDRETLASAKAFAPKVWKSRQVAVVGGDYEALAGSYADPLFGRVAVAKAISSRSAESDLTVRNYLVDIQAALAVLDAALQLSRGAIAAAADSIDASVSESSAAVSAATSAQSSITARATSARAGARSIRDGAGEISVDSADIGDHVVSGKAATDASSATGGEKTTIRGWFDLIAAEAIAVGTAAGGVEAAAASVVTDVNAVLDEVQALGASLANISTSNAGITARTTIIRDELSDMATAEGALRGVVHDSEVGITEHLDRLLAADCKANLVTVPILVRDSGGFYAAPSSGLIASLQAFLDSRKEVTQTVAVTSGENFLVRAVIRVRVGVRDGHSEAAVKMAVEAAVSGVLRGRAFGVSLYESDLDDAVLGIDGVSFVNARVEGHLGVGGVGVLGTHLDPDGNLIVSESEVVTLGQLTITTEGASI